MLVLFILMTAVADEIYGGIDDTAVDHYDGDDLPDFYDLETSTLATSTKIPKNVKCLQQCVKKCGGEIPKGSAYLLTYKVYIRISKIFVEFNVQI